MQTKKTALITGANRGIGFEVAKQLAEKGFQAFLTARRVDAGRKATSTLREKGLDVEFIELDVASQESIRKAAIQLAAIVDHLDVLVNNAAICPDEGISPLDVDPALVMETLQINCIGPLMMIQNFWPLLAKSESGRLINVSSSAGALHDMNEYAPGYSISKTSLNAITRQTAAALHRHGIAVNSVCPGWVRTEMGGPAAPRSVEKGAATIVWLATEAPASLSGKFLRDKKSIPW